MSGPLRRVVAIDLIAVLVPQARHKIGGIHPAVGGAIRPDPGHRPYSQDEHCANNHYDYDHENGLSPMHYVSPRPAKGEAVALSAVYTSSHHSIGSVFPPRCARLGVNTAAICTPYTRVAFAAALRSRSIG
ncbi:hypothetical protein ABIA39_008922 [Nocardia sp. GAS34]